MTAYLMTWKPDEKPGYWSEKDLLNNVLLPFKRDGLVNVAWRTVSTVQMKVGDKIFIMKQGKPKWPTGIFARGKITEKPFLDIDGKSRVKIDIIELVDPAKGFFVDSKGCEEILGPLAFARSSGQVLSIEQEVYLDEIFAQANLSLKNENENSKWTYSELESTVDAYFLMLEYEENKISYKKSAVNKLLRENALHRRSKASIEYRMQNISYIVEKLGIEFLKGYMPARNVGKISENTILSIILSKDYLNSKIFKVNSTYQIRIDEVANLRNQTDLVAPIGNKQPIKTWRLASNFKRDANVVAWTLNESKGICEGCNLPAPFTDDLNHPFLEVHHVVWLSEGGSDTIENAVALCPNCHRRLHFSSDRNNYKAQLYKKIKRLTAK